ncbi:MAG: 30S ribosomal protein bS22 [Anaerolineae bacterium]
MPNVKKWRKKKLAKHKHRKLLKRTRWQRKRKK